MISPIETSYKGNLFRSRLEARWAVFFDTLGFKYVYEPEGYDLSGVWYLPDFWIPDWHTFVEIKPEQPTQGQKEKCQRLSTLTNNQVLLIAGQPWVKEYEIFLFEPNNPYLFSPEDIDPKSEDGDIYYSNLLGTPLEFAQDRKDRRVIWLVNKGEFSGSSFYVPPDPHPRWGETYPLTGDASDEIVMAFESARKERFVR
jgi:hypothetical protein